jgi:hypothetical protein
MPTTPGTLSVPVNLSSPSYATSGGTNYIAPQIGGSSPSISFSGGNSNSILGILALLVVFFVKEFV